MEVFDDDVDHIVAEIQDYQLSHGSVIRQVLFDGPATSNPVGVSIRPTRFSRQHFDKAMSLQKYFNELYVKASADIQFLHDSLKTILPQDEFLAALWDIQCKASRSSKKISCGIFRSDYMVHAAGPNPGISHTLGIITAKGHVLWLPENMLIVPKQRQVEMNTFSVAGAVHAETTVNMHKYINRISAVRDQIPDCQNIKSLVETLLEAHSFYSPASTHACSILMIVQPCNFNKADEKPIEYGLWNAGVPCYRCEWDLVLERTRQLDDGSLLFKSQFRERELEISVVYYRAGYEAGEYDDLGKHTRLYLETSRAIQCPNVLTHLTTFKAVQQALGEPEAIERFLPEIPASEVRSTFMPMQPLQGSLGRQLAHGLGNPSHYVLKPNLEGGGHNVYGEDIPRFLKSLQRHEWTKFVLMQRIEPEVTDGRLLTAHGFYEGPVVSELGILGTCLWQEDATDGVRMLSNRVAGWTFKTKPADVDEMSVVKGYGVFDVPQF